MTDMKIACAIILVAMAALAWACCSYDPFDD